jgi:hypothetical protein
VTRIDMTTREWHELVKPVLPHRLDDKTFPELAQVRVEVHERSVVAVATDRYTLAAERHTLAAADAVYDPPPPIAIPAAEIAATLKLFTYSKDDDPRLRITIEQTRLPLEIIGEQTSVGCYTLTIADPDASSVVLRDALNPNGDPLARWRVMLRAALRRNLVAAPPALCLHAAHFARWSAAVRAGERLAIYLGDRDAKTLLVLVEDHFAGLWVPVSYLDGPEQMLRDSPWRYELAGFHDDPGDDDQGDHHHNQEGTTPDDQ